ncbi:MAG TPA: hypothetical protein VIQ30_10655 [Pseudonocardia sp.]
MSTLPSMPGCGQPATIRIEIYRPGNGSLYGSLEAVVYMCERHGIEAVSAAQAAGLTGHRGNAPMPLDRPCGHVYAFPTAAAERSDDEQHPSWCDRKGCADRGEHRSVAMGVKPSPDDLTAVTVHLVQLTAAPATPVLVALTFVAEDPADTAEQLVTLDRAVALTYRIRGLADRAKGRRR